MDPGSDVNSGLLRASLLVALTKACPARGAGAAPVDAFLVLQSIAFVSRTCMASSQHRAAQPPQT